MRRRPTGWPAAFPGPLPCLAMPPAKGCRAPRRMGDGVVDVMRIRQERNNLSELGVNWIGKGHLNACESDLMFKYHVAHLSDVYGGRSKVNNCTPRSVSNPPPWANLDPRVLSPIPDKRKREARWDNHFSRENCLWKDNRSAERCFGSGSRSTTARRRPASAGVRKGAEATSALHANDGVRLRGRPSSANVRGREVYNGKGDIIDDIRRNDARRLGVASRRRRLNDDSRSVGGGGNFPREDNAAKTDCTIHDNGVYSLEERDIMNGAYKLDEKQESTFRDFVAMLVDFDTCRAVNIINDAFRQAQLATGLQDFTGCEDN